MNYYLFRFDWIFGPDFFIMILKGFPKIKSRIPKIAKNCLYCKAGRKKAVKTSLSNFWNPAFYFWNLAFYFWNLTFYFWNFAFYFWKTL